MRPFPSVVSGLETSPLLPFVIYALSWIIVVCFAYRLGLYSRGSRQLLRLMREDAGFEFGDLTIEIDDAKPLRKRTRNRFARLMVDEIKAKIGPLNHSDANKLVVGREFRKLAEEKGVRPSHVIALAPIVVAAYFVPTVHDVDAHMWVASREYKDSVAYRRGGLMERLGVWLGLRPYNGDADDLGE